MSSHLARLEALLFVAGEDGLSLRTMAQLLEMPVTGLTQSLEKLQAKYAADEDSALCLLESSNTYKLVTKPDFASLLRDYSKTPINQSLSRASLEVLSIVAYKQPITRAEVDDIRGVNSSGAIAKLQAFDLIQEAGKKDAVGRPNLYATTDYFLDYMGINSLDELVAIDQLELEDQETSLFREDASEKFLSLIAVLPGALQSFWPSLHPLDLLVGLCCGGSLRLAVYLKSKNAKKYRHGLEYGSARWGTREDIAPYVDPVFQNNVILTKTESLTMNSRPKDPKTARNKNVLVIGGSGSGKTRFWLKPNLMQMHSSYVVTDPKGTILVECGKMLQRGAPKLGKDGKPMKDKHGKVIYEPYRIKVLNTINFKKSMHYNPFAYARHEVA